MGSIIHRYKHLLNLDPALKKLVHATVYSRSHRKNQTIGGMLVHNKYRATLVEVLVINLSNIVVDHEKEGDIYITIKNYIISRWI